MKKCKCRNFNTSPLPNIHIIAVKPHRKPWGLVCTRVKLHFTSRKLTHHLGKLATNYVSKSLKSDLRFSFCQNVELKGAQAPSFVPSPLSFLAAEVLSFLPRLSGPWLGRRAPG